MSRYISAECRYLSPYESEVSICAFQRILQRSISRSVRFSLGVPDRPLFSSRSTIKSLPASNVCIHEIRGNRDRRYKSPLWRDFCAVATFDNRSRRTAFKIIKFAIIFANVRLYLTVYHVFRAYLPLKQRALIIQEIVSPALSPFLSHIYF